MAAASVFSLQNDELTEYRKKEEGRGREKKGEMVEHGKLKFCIVASFISIAIDKWEEELNSNMK